MKRISRKLTSLFLVFAMLIAMLLPNAGVLAVEESNSGTKFYSVIVDPLEHGVMKADKEAYLPGETVTLIVQADKGYRLKEASAEETDGEKLELEETEDSLQFEMPESNVKVTAVMEKEAEGETESDKPVEKLQTESSKETESIQKEPETKQTEEVNEPGTKEPKASNEEEVQSSEEGSGNWNAPEQKAAMLAIQNEASERESRSAEDDVDYESIKNNAKGLFQGATKITDGMVMPNGYTGFMRRTTGLAPTLHFSYDSTYETGDKSYPSIILKSSYKDGRISATYPRSCYYNGTWIDIRVTATDWKRDGNNNINMFFTGERPGVMVQNCAWIELKYDFYVAGTTTPIVVKGYSTWKDIDFDQGVVLKDGFVKTKASIYAVDGAQANLAYQTVNGNPYFFDDHNSNATDEMPGHMITALYEGSTLKAVYTFVRHTVNTTGGGAITNESDKYVPGPVSIQKRVSDNDEKLVTEDTLNQSPEPRKEGFIYTITATTAGETESTYYMHYEIFDILDQCLNVNSSGITITDASGANVKGWFDVTVDGANGLTINAKSTALRNASFYGNVYTINVPVTIRDYVDLRAAQYWDAAKNMAHIDNQAVLNSDACGGEIASNQVKTWVPMYMMPDGWLTIVKTEDGTDIPLDGVTFQVYEWNGSSYNTVAYDTLSDAREKGTYKNTKPYIYTSTNQGKFKVVETQSAVDHFNSGWSQELQYDGTAAKTLTYSVTNPKMEPKIAVTKLADRTVLEEGVKTPGWYKYEDKITYAIVAKNTGNVAVKNMIVTDTMSEELQKAVDVESAAFEVPDTLETANGAQARVTKNSATQVTIDALEPGDSVLLTFAVNVGSRDQVRNLDNLINLDNVVKVTATYHNGHQDAAVPEDEDDTDNDKVSVYNPLISVMKMADRTTLEKDEIGQLTRKSGWYDFEESVTYTMVAKNYGNVPVYNLMVLDTLSEELANATDADAAAFVVEQEETVTEQGNPIRITKDPENGKKLTLDALEAGDSVTLTFTARIRPRRDLKDFLLEKLENLNNHVQITGVFHTYEEEPVPVPPDEDDYDDDAINIYNPLISVTKLADRTTVQEDGTKIQGWYDYKDVITYRIEVRNYGNVQVNNLAVEDTLSEELAAAVYADNAEFVLELAEPETEETEGTTEESQAPEQAASRQEEGESETASETEASGETEAPEDPVEPETVSIVSENGKQVKVTKNPENGKLVTLDALAPGDGVTLTFKAQVRPREDVKDFDSAHLEKLNNHVRITGEYDNSDPDPSPAPVPEDEDDFSDDQVNIFNPLISVTKLADRTEMTGEGIKTPGEYDFEETITYSILVRNYGNTTATDLALEDTLSEELKKTIDVPAASFVEGTLKTEKGKEAKAVKESNTKLILDRLEAGDSVIVTFQAKVKSREELKDYAAAELEKLNNHVKVTGKYDGGKTITTDEDDDDDETINVRNPKLSVIKVADKTSGITINDGTYTGEKKPGLYDFGDKVTYDIIVKNTGNVEIFNINVTDIMSKRLQKAAELDECGFKIDNDMKTAQGKRAEVALDQDGKAIVESLEPGDSVTLKFVVTLKPDHIKVFQNLKNAVTVTGEYDPDDPKGVPQDEDDSDEDGIEIAYGLLEIIKVSSKNQMVLEGAEFELYREDGTLIDTLTTDGKGAAASCELGTGEYYLIETKAPEGYRLDASKISFKVTKNLQTIKKKIKNDPEPEQPKETEEPKQTPKQTPTSTVNPPKTGDGTNAGIYLLLIAAAIAVFGAMEWRKKKKTESAAKPEE